MSKFWGWVERREDGGFDVGEYSKQNYDQTGGTITGHKVPEDVLELMAVLDLTDGSKLPGGSHKGWKSYFISHKDLKTQEEE